MVKKGYIKLHRALLDNPIMIDPKRLTVFIYCLLRAMHKAVVIDVHGYPLRLERGEFLCGRERAADELEMSEGVFRRAIANLKKRNMVKTRVERGINVISVVKFDTYQGPDDEIPASQRISLFDQTTELQDSIDKINDLEVKVTSEVSDVSDFTHPLNKNVTNKKELITTGETDVAVKSEKAPGAVPINKRIGSYFCDKFQEKFGARYHFVFGKDNAIIKRIIDTYESPELIESFIDEYFADTDSFLVKTGYPISMLERRTNAYSAARAEVSEESWDSAMESRVSDVTDYFYGYYKRTLSNDYPHNKTKDRALFHKLIAEFDPKFDHPGKTVDFVKDIVRCYIDDNSQFMAVQAWPAWIIERNYPKYAELIFSWRTGG